jgi:riboflavin kinase/FMN adenylyltransferase
MLGLACQIPAMHLYRSVNTIPADSKSRVVAIGVFDGLHIGHRQLIAEAQTLARSRGARATVLTFEPMPREYLSPENPPARLTSFRERCELIRDMGVDELCCLRFGSVQRLESEEFIDSLLVGRLMASAVIVGDDFRFGAGRQGTVEDLIEASRLRDFDVRQIPPVVCQGTRVSSTGVRQALADGDLAAARLMLGRDYSMSGKVARGLSLGRELGFPTANISMGRRVPAVSGVFAVRVAGIGEALLDAVASLGTRPTIGGDSPLLEVHLFDFDKDIYGRRIEVRFISKLRSEEKFSDLEAMRKQMKVDADQARAALSASIA